jgi:hypothetical protein
MDNGCGGASTSGIDLRSRAEGAANSPRRFGWRPHTTFMGVMGLALLALTSWAFVRELLPAHGPIPSIATHAQTRSGHHS